MNPLLLDLPEAFETDRLWIRAPRPGDGAAVNAAIRESLADLRPWMVWAQREMTTDESEARNRQALADFAQHRYFRFYIWRKSDELFVGELSLRPVDWQVPLFEVGYWLRMSAQGHGYMTEGLQGLVEYAFTHVGVQRLELLCDPRNPRSAAVAERTGFHLEGRLERSWRGMQGELADTLLYVQVADGERDVRERASQYLLPLHPLLLDLPDQLETERLILRPPRAGDGPMVQDAIEESEANLKRWMPWMRPGHSLKDSELHARESAAAYIRRESLMYRLMRRSDGLFVGNVSAHAFAWDVPRCEMGYWVRARLEGQGYVTEAVNRLTTFAFDDLGMNRIEIHCDGRNRRSAAVAERAGFTLEACLHHHRRGVDGALADTLIYTKLRGET